MMDWSPLDRELALWRETGRILPFWWRDDDATTPTPALDRLLDLARGRDLPVHLAVIPARSTADLAARLVDAPRAIALVHGWAHRSHARGDAKKAEFGPDRDVAAGLADAERGLLRMQRLFGARLCPVFVPPWNRIAPAIAAGLPDLGYTALSTFGPRPRGIAPAGLVEVNTHLDPVDWRGSRGLIDPDALIAQTAAMLAARRTGQGDADEPFGLLTHHLVHDAALWDFVAALLDRLCAAPVTRWTAHSTDPLPEDTA